MKQFSITTSDLSHILSLSPQRILAISNECQLEQNSEVFNKGKFKIYSPSGIKKILAKKNIISTHPRVIAFGNNKGGVGKSSTAVNTALMLSSFGYKTLLIDSDGQANSTSLFIDDVETFSLVEILMKQTTIQNAIVKLTDTLSLLPSNLYNQTLPALLTGKPRNTLKNLISPIQNDFDFIIWDCNPSLDITNHQIYYSCTDIFIVTIMEILSLQGVEMTKDTLQSCFADTTVPMPKVQILINKLDPRILSQAKLLTKLNETGLDICQTIIVTDNTIPKSQEDKFLITNKNKSFESYLELAVRIINDDKTKLPNKMGYYAEQTQSL